MESPMDILAKEYAAEDSQTALTLVDSPKDNDSDPEDTMQEDTVIQNQDTYIDNIIHSRAPRIDSQYSDATPITSPNINMQQQKRSSNAHNILHHNPSSQSMAHQPSQDFLVMMEGLQKKLNQRDQALKLMATQLKQKNDEYETLFKSNLELQNKMETLTLVNKEQSEQLQTKDKDIANLKEEISAKETMVNSLSEEIEHYQQCEQWLAMQIKWESDTNSAKLSVEALEQWKHSMLNQNAHAMDDDDHKQYHDEANEETKALLGTNQTEPTRNRKKVNAQVEAQVDDNACSCMPWFK